MRLLIGFANALRTKLSAKGGFVDLDSPSFAASPPPILKRPPIVLPFLLIALALLVAVLLVTGAALIVTQKTITLDVDGQLITVHTRQATVAGLLEEIALPLAPGDSLAPPPETRLQNGVIVRVRRAREVIVTADGQTITLRTQLYLPQDLLDAAGITLGRYDVLLADGRPVADPAQEQPAFTLLEVIRAVPVEIDDGGQTVTLYTTAPTVGRALDAAGITLYGADVITPPPETPVSPGLRVTVERATPLTIRVDGVEVQTRTHAATVAGALTAAGLALVGEDYSVPPPEAPLPADGVIRVVRVTEERLVERLAIPYDTVYRADSGMELDTLRVIQAGVPGIAERVTRVRYEDGVEVSRVVEPPRVQLPPTDEVLAYGTEVVLRTLDTPEGEITYWRTIRMLATSYSPATSSKPPDAPNYGIAGTGIPVERGIVAIDPDVIPYFTQLYIPGYGRGLAADSGGAINGRRIDLGYGDDDLELWYSWVDVYLLPPVPPPDEIPYLLP